jgi:hypothetical protein
MGIKPNLIQNLRILLQLEQAVHLLEAIDWSFLRAMTSLRSLDISMAMIEACPNHGPTAGHWKCSLFMRALIMDLVMVVPASIELRWGPWEGLGSHHTELKKHNRIYYLDGSVMKQVANDFTLLRGSKALAPLRSGSVKESDGE